MKTIKRSSGLLQQFKEMKRQHWMSLNIMPDDYKFDLAEVSIYLSENLESKPHRNMYNVSLPVCFSAGQLMFKKTDIDRWLISIEKVGLLNRLSELEQQEKFLWEKKFISDPLPF